MSEQFYITRIGRDLSTAEPCFSYLSKGCGWCKSLGEAMPFKNIEAAQARLGDRVGKILPVSEIKSSPYHQTEMKSPAKKLQAVEILKPAKLAPAANLKSGNDAAAAKQLNKLFTEAQNGMRRVVALGLFAWEIKEGQLKHGEFGAWLAEHCPKLATINSITGKPVASRALSGYMELTKNVLESCGCPSIEKYLATVAKFADDANLKPGQFLLIADKKVPESLAPMREKIFELVDGKTQRSLFLEFKQCEEDSETPKRGRLKGSTGLTKEQRELAAQRAEEERLAELEEQTKETTKWLMENADAKNLGMMDSKVLVKLQDAAQTASGFITRLMESRSASRTGNHNGGAQ